MHSWADTYRCTCIHLYIGSHHIYLTPTNFLHREVWVKLNRAVRGGIICPPNSPALIITDLFFLQLALWLAWALGAMQWSFYYLLLECWGVTRTSQVLFAPPLRIWFFLLTEQRSSILGIEIFNTLQVLEKLWLEQSCEVVVRHVLGWLLSQHSHNRFIHSRVEACGLETLGRRNRDMKEIQRHRIVLGEWLSEYWRLNSPV